jgi:hypothetical protein
LGEQGFRIIAVFENPPEHYHVVAQQDYMPPRPGEGG